MNKTLKIRQTAIDKTTDLVYNTLMNNTTEENEMTIQEWTINGLNFVYVPSLKVLVTEFPNGETEETHNVPTWWEAGKLAANYVMQSLKNKCHKVQK
jgi:hypothetical protein